MTYEQFTAFVRFHFPESKVEALPIWKEFIEDNVQSGLTVQFKEEDEKKALEEWYDVLCGGFFLVQDRMGKRAAVSVINVSCERCCLYPGEMLQAAVCLQNGENGKAILNKISNCEIEAEEPFFPKPSPEAISQAFSHQEQEKSKEPTNEILD